MPVYNHDGDNCTPVNARQHVWKPFRCYRLLACPDRDARECFFFDDNILQVRRAAIRDPNVPPEVLNFDNRVTLLANSQRKSVHIETGT